MESNYIRYEYDPNWYIENMKKIIEIAQINGIRIELNTEDNIVEVENTISKEECLLDLKEVMSSY